MGMSTHVEGFKPPDKKWLQMKTVYDACHDAGVDPPDEVSDFFEDGPPDAAGVRVELGSRYGEKHECCTEYSDDAANGFEIDVTKLPKDVKIIRFYNAY